MTHDLSYLGNNIKEVKENLNKLTKYKSEIRRAYRTIQVFLETNYYLEKIHSMKLKKDLFLSDKLSLIESCRLHFNSVFKKKDINTKKETWANFLVEFAFNTTSIEGNTIGLQEARNLLEEGLTPKDKTLREIYDLQNTEKIFSDLNNSEFEKELNHDLILKIHSILMENIDDRKGYRTSDVKVFKSNFKATPAPYVKTDMDLLLEWYCKNKKNLHPFVLAVLFHHKFEKIHPFMDGNGRTGRIILNYILLKNNYPPVIIHKKLRKEYLDFMNLADKSMLFESEAKHYEKLVQFIATEVYSSYWDIFL